ncbi:MarR family winged helix-turn-helix transcriptional regulator [Streptomyces sp. CBMA29]|uniref:MarR family winged helix-turn-helix transcriptional regulator n=1 Tax=Streptomyces sp. CBMA29 TaxID=1896314 RepID=UPI001661CCA6|nr:MarR family transcriptional regulator [Streptomyces sp. CBMA29]
MTRRRSDPLTVEVVGLIGTVAARYHQEYESAAARHRLTGAQAKVLALLNAGPLPMRQIARWLKCEPSNVTGIVDRLEVRGLAERRTDPADRRIKLAAATAEGHAVADKLRDSLDFAREPLAGLSEQERTMLRDLLRQMLGDDPAAGANRDHSLGHASGAGREPGEGATADAR